MEDLQASVVAAFQRERSAILASLIRGAGDFELAEDCLQDALVAALETWTTAGVPDRPGAWLLATARNRLVDRRRREGTLARIRRERIRELENAQAHRAMEHSEVANCTMLDDDRLRLVFTCCHPALDPDSRVALTLQVVGGLTAVEVGRAFLVSEAAMSQRLVRVKRKIRDAGIPYRVPPPELLEERLPGVRATLYLLFNEGYAPTEGEPLLRRELCEEAIRLARLLRAVLPRDPETEGLCALMLLHHSRRDARTDSDGNLVPLDEQDRARWDRALADEGTAILEAALASGRPGPYQVQAAISGLHCAARDGPAATDWAQIAALYSVLRTMDPSPVIELNEIVARALAGAPEQGVARLEHLAERTELGAYQPYHAAHADLLRRAGRSRDAATAYTRAIALSRNAAERRFLERRRTTCLHAD